jgi:hypothetical protein
VDGGIYGVFPMAAKPIHSHVSSRLIALAEAHSAVGFRQIKDIGGNWLGKEMCATSMIPDSLLSTK